MKSISKFLVVVVIILLAAFVLVNSLPFVLNTQPPIVMMEGISMQPTYYEGELLLLKGIPTTDIRIGDVVAYRRSSSGLRIIHRVIAIRTRNNELYSNPFPDAEIQASYVTGVVSFHVPASIGRVVYMVVLWLQNPLFLVLSIGLIAVILSVLNLSTIKKSGSPRRFCKYCGTDTDENAIFCGKCGKKIA
jgi:signal peptidase I